MGTLSLLGSFCKLKNIQIGRFEKNGICTKTIVKIFESTKSGRRRYKSEHDIYKRLSGIKTEVLPKIWWIGQLTKNNHVIVMEMGKMSLYELIKSASSTPIPFKMFIFYLINMGNAILFLHSHKIRHGDVKLQNFILTYANKLKIIDFDLSEHIKSKPTFKYCNIGGTVPYMSPENYMAYMGYGSIVGFASDIWSLGICMYYMFTGKYPINWELINIKDIVKIINTLTLDTKCILGRWIDVDIKLLNKTIALMYIMIVYN